MRYFQAKLLFLNINVHHSHTKVPGSLCATLKQNYKSAKSICATLIQQSQCPYSLCVALKQNGWSEKSMCATHTKVPESKFNVRHSSSKSLSLASLAKTFPWQDPLGSNRYVRHSQAKLLVLLRTCTNPTQTSGGAINMSPLSIKNS